MRIGFGAMHFSYDKDSGLHGNRHAGKVGELNNTSSYLEKLGTSRESKS
jgi:hypothetical protein